jgi:DNA polymerase (family 10)
LAAGALDRSAIAAALRELGDLLALKGENPFKIRAYETGARALEGLDGDLALLIAQGRLTETAGIGEALAGKIAELHATGHCAALDKLRGELPAGMVELVKLPNFGPKKAKALHEALGIASVAELKAACEAGRVRTVKGFGEKTEHKILEGIAQAAARGKRHLLSDARAVGEELLAFLRAVPAVERAELGGSARRWRETVADLDVLVATRDPVAVMDRFVTFPKVAQVEGRGDTKCTVRLADGFQIDLRAMPPEDWATALHHFTGSKAHHTKLRGLARDLGYTLSEWGLQRLDDGSKIPIASEAELYAKLGLPEIPPELREDEGEIEAARDGTLPTDLIELQDIRGLVHCHTIHSDGRATIAEMARGADAMGMAYLTITDHSPTASYAKGVQADRLKAQWDEIDRVQEKVRVRLLKGTESDILADGALDYPDAILERFEVIIASVHSRMGLDEEAMTRRLVTAMRLPFFKIWGHALGRLLLEREPFACRVEEILDAIAASRAAVEVNGDPRRLDLEPRWIRAARRRGIKLVISVDAHSVEGLGNLRFGVHTARRGWVRKGEVLNALELEEFRRAVRPV